MKKALIPILSAVCVFAGLSQAATLYTSGTPGSPANAFYSDPDAGETGVWAASRFTISTGVSISSLIVDGFYGFTSPTDHFDLVIMAGGGSLPGAVVASAANVSSTRTNISGSFYQFTLTLASPVVLEAGTYWLSVASVAGEGDLWGWATSAGTGTAAITEISPTSYDTPVSRLYTYQLEGTQTVPEPSALLLGPVGMALLARRKRA